MVPRITGTPERRTLTVTLHLNRPLAPQLVLWRGAGISWALLGELSGLSRQRMHVLVDDWARAKSLVPSKTKPARLLTNMSTSARLRVV